MDLERIRQNVFSANTRLYCVLDGVMVQDLPIKLREAQVPHHCILTGDLTPDVVHAAPYLAYLSPDSKFADWVLSEAFGKSWGIFFRSHRSMLEMRRHFRALHQAFDEHGNPLKFRYYDPRVLRAFLPTCNAGELKTLFGDVEQFFIETKEVGGIERYRLSDGNLDIKQLNSEAK
jgi:hypothetical protein